MHRSVEVSTAVADRPGSSTVGLGTSLGAAPVATPLATPPPVRVEVLPRPGAADAPILRFRLAAIFAAQLFDFATFTIMVERHGISAELNPIVAASFEIGGLPVLFFVKLALVTLVGSTIVILGRRRPSVHLPSRLASAITVLAVIGGVFAGFTNVITW